MSDVKSRNIEDQTSSSNAPSGATLDSHRNSNIMDHKYGSVNLQHLQPQIRALIEQIMQYTNVNFPITGLAATLASNNPVLEVGEIGYETDTLSFKIGDGSTAYNSLTYVYRGLPVTGEGSLNTAHITSDSNRSATLVVNTSTNTAGVWSAAVTMTGVPAGAKAAWCLCYIQKTGAIPSLAVEAATGYTLSDITSGTNEWKYWGIAAAGSGSYCFGMLKIHLDANKQFKWCSGVTNSTVQIGSAIDYEM